MTVYFYHTQDIQMILEKLAKNEFPPHFLYGATKLERHGIDVVWHKSKLGLPRWKMMLRNAWQVLTCREKFDAVYATHYQGLELIVLLRALRLFRKPIVIWHHQPIITPRQRWRETLGKLFYRGFDHMIFFSEKLIRDSLCSKKARPERMHLGHWGMDIPSWPVSPPLEGSGEASFIHSGKEMRDMPTLIQAFNKTGASLEVYINKQNGDVKYGDIFKDLEISENIHLHFPERLAPYEIGLKVMQADCVCICCQETKYTVGLTTLVEALALGKPIITSRNPQYPFDPEEEGCGLSVGYGDVDGWIRAIDHIRQHPDEAKKMGQRAQELARTRYNDEICAREVAEILSEVRGKR